MSSSLHMWFHQESSFFGSSVLIILVCIKKKTLSVGPLLVLRTVTKTPTYIHTDLMEDEGRGWVQPRLMGRVEDG